MSLIEISNENELESRSNDDQESRKNERINLFSANWFDNDDGDDELANLLLTCVKYS
jgi:hypothetical protein